MSADRIPIHFTPQQLDYVANTLATRPFAEVHLLLADMTQQVAAHNGTHTTAQPVNGAVEASQAVQ